MFGLKKEKKEKKAKTRMKIIYIYIYIIYFLHIYLNHFTCFHPRKLTKLEKLILLKILKVRTLSYKYNFVVETDILLICKS